MNRRNRARWGLVSLLLLVAATAGLLAGSGLLERLLGVRRVLGVPVADLVLLPSPVVDRWNQLGSWAPAAVAVLGLIAIWRGLHLIRAQLRRGGGRTDIGNLSLPAAAVTGVAPVGHPLGGGWTVVRAPALSHGTERALTGIRGVEQARVGLYGDAQQPELRSQLKVISRTGLDQLRHDVAHVLDQYTAMTGTRLAGADITVSLVERSSQPLARRLIPEQVRRAAVITAGTLVTVIGIALLALPGPGILVVFFGLGLLAKELPWARRLLDRVKDSYRRFTVRLRRMRAARVH
jgi:uncharacterized protein (TIGR02611 family)